MRVLRCLDLKWWTIGCFQSFNVCSCFLKEGPLKIPRNSARIGGFRWEQKSLEGCKEPSYTWQGWLPFYSMREKVLLLAIILTFVSYNHSCHRSCKHNWYCNRTTHINNHISHIIVDLCVLCGWSKFIIHTHLYSLWYGFMVHLPPRLHPSVGALAPSKAPPSSIVTGAWRKRFFFVVACLKNIKFPKSLLWNSWRILGLLVL